MQLHSSMNALSQLHLWTGARKRPAFYEETPATAT